MNDQASDPTEPKQLVAVFERHADVGAARDALLGAGLPAHAIQSGASATGAEPQGDGFWSAVRRWLAPGDDAFPHGEGDAERRMLSVRPESAAERDTAIEVIRGFGPVELAETASADNRQAPSGDGDLRTTYTYGVPDEVAQAMTAEEQVLAQPPAKAARLNFVRIVEERVRAGRPGPHEVAAPASYVASGVRQRVELQEETIETAAERPLS